MWINKYIEKKNCTEKHGTTKIITLDYIGWQERLKKNVFMK